MFKKRWVRITTLVLALVCLVSLASAAAPQYDQNGDGKVDVWDLQLLVNKNETASYAAALTEVLDGGDELHPNAAGVYEIYSYVGLYNMAKLSGKGYSFKLMADIDLQGKDWTPVTLKGSFDGNLHTISNVTITKGVASTYKVTSDMGFFAMVDNYKVGSETVQSVVKNLNLENVQITAADDAQFVGLIAGSNRGKIENCTTTGIIIDNRTTLPDKVYVGAFVGRNNDSTPPGTISTGTNLLTYTDPVGNKTTGLSSQLALQLEDLSYPEGTEADKQYARTIGIAASTKDANIDETMIWQDVSNDSRLLSQTEQDLRNTVEQKMYQMGTVKWTPSETVTFTRYNSSTGEAQTTHTHSNAFLAGETYTGMPYVPGYNGSFERFLSQMEEDGQGNLKTVTGLEDGTRYDPANERTTGMVRYMGNNCSIAVGWAWAAVSPTRVYNDDVASVYGGAAIRSAYYMVPTTYNIEHYGTIPVGGYQIPESYASGVDTRDTAALINYLGAQEMAEAYAKAHKGDAITFADYWDEQSDGSVLPQYDNSHIRMIAADPVIIRNYKNVIDLEASYVLTHEQGDGLNDNKDSNGKWLKTYTDELGAYNVKYTSWRINHKYTLSVLLTEEGYNAAKTAASEATTNGTFVNGMQPGCGWGYVPVTMRAFSDKTQKSPYYAEYTSSPVTLPNTGWFYSNYWTIGGTMVIKDADGNEVYNQTKYFTDRDASTDFSTIKLGQDFPDADDGLIEGETYTMTLSFLASNGKTTYIKPSGKATWTSSTTKPLEMEFVYEKVTDTTTPEDPDPGDGDIEDSGNE